LLPIKSDIVFKVVFGKPKNVDILAKFLEAILDIDIEKPEDITLTNTELSSDYDGDKLSRFDIRVKLADRSEVEIEIQIQDKHDMIPRALYYEAKLFSEQLKEGERYQHIPRAITLNILDFNLLLSERFLNRYRYMNTVDYEELSNLCEINFLELKKVPKKCYNDKEMWALFIATNDEEVIDMLVNKNKDIKKAVEKLEYVSSDRDERFRIDQIDKARIDRLAENAANREEGFDEGMEQGIEQGIEQGEARGEANGEIAAKHQIALKMLSKSYSVELISSVTGLTSDEIKDFDKE